MIIVSKTGGVLHAYNSPTYFRGEQHGTKDLIRRLHQKGVPVLYYGLITGELPAGVPVIKPTLPKKLNVWVTPSAQEEAWETDAKVLESYGVFANDPQNLWIQSTGITGTWSYVVNPAGSYPRTNDLRYNAPMLGLMHKLGIKRVGFSADVRSEILDCEMTTIWPDTLPVGLLSQRTYEDRVHLQGSDLLRRTVNSQSESWPYLERKPYSSGIRSLIIGSHAHIGTGFKKPQRDQAWADLLYKGDSVFDALPDAFVAGEGWEEFSRYERHHSRYVGPATPSDLNFALEQTRVSPIIAPDRNYLTNKPYLVKALGCIPLVYSNTDNPHAWDPEYTLLPKNHPCRVSDANGVVAAAGWSDYFRGEVLEDLHERLPQRFDVLDALIQDWTDGLYFKDRNTWWQRYGGYRYV
jgi:hypothetical protein